MKKVAKAILIALGIILVVGAVMVLGVNLYVQSAGTRARIERGLSKGLHTDVKIGRVSFMPWYGLRISAIERTNTADGNTVRIEAISLKLRLWRLIRHDLVFKKLTVDGANTGLVVQNADGKWILPMPSAAAAPESPVEQSSPAPEQNPSQDLETRPVAINLALLRDASFSFYDRNHRSLLSLTGVVVQTPSPTDKLVSGSAGVDSISLLDGFFIKDWRGVFRYTPEEFSLLDSRCKIGDGEATGTLDVKIAGQDSTFALDTKFNGVSVARLLSDAGATQLQATGMLSGFFHLEGNARDANQAVGRGQIALSGGTISENVLLDSLGILLRTDKFRSLPVDDAHVNFHIAGGMLNFDDITLKSAVLTVSGKGVMGGDSRLYIVCRLAINADIARQVPDYLMQNFAKDDATGARYVDFPITGTITKPDYSAFYSIAGKHMNSKDAILNFLGVRQTNTTPDATPAPQQSPAPKPANPQ